MNIDLIHRWFEGIMSKEFDGGKEHEAIQKGEA
jgi:hypothetical protein